MSNSLNVCLYNQEAGSSEELTRHIKNLSHVRFVAEVSSPDALARLLHDSPIRLVFFHLDSDAKAVVEVIEEVATRFQEVALIGIGHTVAAADILAPMRAGCDQFVCEPVDPEDLANAVARVIARRLHTTTKSKCICVVGASGGVGGTSIACNLAMEIAQQSQRECALIDLDLQMGNVAGNFDCDPKYSIDELAASGTDLNRSILKSTMTRIEERVAILTRPAALERCESVTPEVVERLLNVLSESYDHVVLDAPGHFDPRTETAFCRADLVLVVCQLLVPSIRNAKRFSDGLGRLGVPPERIEFLVNRTDGRAGRLTERDVAETVKKPVFATVPNDFQFLARSIEAGKPIASLDQNNAVRAAIRKIARKIMAGMALSVAQTRKNSESKKKLTGTLLSR